MRKLTDLKPEILGEAISELSRFSDEQRNALLHAAMALANRSAASQLLVSSLDVLRNHPDAFYVWCDVGRKVASASAVAAEEYFRRSPEVLNEVRKEELESWARLGARIAEKSAEAAAEYFRSSCKLLRTLPPSDVIRWGNEGYGILEDGGLASEKAAIEYFALGTRKSFERSRAEPTALLEENARVLKLYGEAISGKDVDIQPSGESFGTDGRSIYLPVSLNAYGEREKNFKLYRALTARLAGRFAYGSFDLDLGKVGLEARELAVRRKLPPGTRGTEAFFRTYPNPLLAKKIFDILDDARIERILRREYAGIGDDMDLFKNALVAVRKFEVTKPAQAILQALQESLLFGAMPEGIPPRIEEEVKRCLLACNAAGDRVEDTALATDRIYRILEGIPGSEFEFEVPNLPNWGQGFAGLNLGMKGSAWRPSREGIESMGTARLGGKRPTAILRKLLMGAARRVQTVKSLRPGSLEPTELRKEREDAFRYDEWDCDMGDYRRRWCSVREVKVRPGSARFAERALREHSALVAGVRREFQMFKPERLRKEKRQSDGEEVDIDAAIESLLEAKVGNPTMEGRVYTRRNKVQRDVSAAFLVDMSGSTAGWVMDTEKRALLIMCEALEAIGDGYAIYGFSGATRDHIEFHIIKEFDEEYGQTVKGRIGRMASLSQNRDGAAIRHATLKLEQSESKTKLLVVISDGRPLDMVPRPGEPLYQGNYSVQDTRMALKEAKAKGVRPFCITVDKKAADYISTMYAEVNYAIIDDVSKLPEKMPAIYRRLTT
ncbi:MAG: VWA domain-containing protein [Candidatus Brockarchaeota archaeon]|nr:VWA domain-containing protein [Candidatus Brockarchaeota archaeon]